MKTRIKFEIDNLVRNPRSNFGLLLLPLLGVSREVIASTDSRDAKEYSLIFGWLVFISEIRVIIE